MRPIRSKEETLLMSFVEIKVAKRRGDSWQRRISWHVSIRNSLLFHVVMSYITRRVYKLNPILPTRPWKLLAYLFGGMYAVMF
jgi:hypothetical protein